MQVRIAVVADYVNETNDGKLNVLGIFDTINSNHFPATHPELRLVVSIEFTIAECETERELAVDFIDQDGNRVIRISQPFGVPRPRAAASRIIHNAIMHVRGLPIPHAGNFEFHVLMNDIEIARIPIQASLVEPPAAAT